MHTLIIVALIYAMCLILIQMCFWGSKIQVRSLKLTTKNRQLLLIIGFGLILTLVLF